MNDWQRNTSSAEDAQTYYNEVWTTMSADLDYTQAFRARFIAEAIAELVPKSPRPKILDVGCGRGWMAPFMSPLGDVVGVDFSPEGIEYARTNYGEHGTFQLADPEHPYLGLQKTDFDVVACSEVIEHVPDQDGFLRQISSLLDKDGWCMLTTPNGNVWEEFRVDPLIRDQLQPVENWVTTDEIGALFTRAGFEVVRHEGRPYHIFRYGKTAPLQTQRMHKLFVKLGLQRPYYRAILPTALYQMVAARKVVRG